MSTMLLISHFALWGLVLLQSLAILLLLRQVGALHLRIAPVGARVMPVGPEIGTLAPPVSLEDLDGRDRRLEVGASMDKDLFLLFATPNCAICDSIMPACKELAWEWRSDLRWAVVVFGRRESCKRFRQEHGLQDLLYARAPDVRKQYKIGPTPYAMLIRKDGRVIGKGLVNHMEHLESLIELRNRAKQSNEQKLPTPSGDSGSADQRLFAVREGTQP